MLTARLLEIIAYLKPSEPCLKAYTTTGMAKVDLKQKGPDTSTISSSIDKSGDNGSLPLMGCGNANLENDGGHLVPT